MEEVQESEEVVEEAEAETEEEQQDEVVEEPEEEVVEEVIFRNTIGRIRDIQIQPETGKLYFLSSNSLWLMEKSY